MKRILILSAAYYPKPIGGAEVAIKEITDRIDPDAYTFDLVTIRYDAEVPKEERVGNVGVHRIGITKKGAHAEDFRRFPLHLNKHLFQLLAAWKAHRLHRRHPYDAVWAMMAHSSGVPAVLFTLLHPHVPYILTLQEGDPPEYIERLMRPVMPLFRRVFTMPKRIQAISTFLADWARRMGASCPIVVIPNGVHGERFAQEVDDDERLRVRESMGWREGDVWLVTTSRLVHKNGIDTVIEALPHLPQCVKFAVVGTGPDEALLGEKARERGVSDRVVFLGNIPHERVPAYLHTALIFIRPSRSEGMGNSFIEAMAAGCPVIATQEGGIADFLFDAERNPETPSTGFAVDKDNPLQIADRVRYLIAHPDEVREVTARARVMVRKRYEWDTVARRMSEEVFDTAVQSSMSPEGVDASSLR